MKKQFIILSLISFIIITISCKEENKVLLFNGENLENWEIFVPDSGAVPEELFWVEDGLIQVAGIPDGYIRTKETYSNFKLHVEWRWVSEPKNSGVLLHINGENKLWPNCIEAQLANQNAGDLVPIQPGAGVTVDGTEYLLENDSIWYIIIPKMHESSENAPGEWNAYDILCSGSDIELTVNGVLQNKGTNATLTSGSIGVQSEGGPMEFRNIWLEPLE
ncbi:MAG: DUF1080 domain-containing protein [Bacteroidales bacterium]|nr:DUF1080 domain-containing protein [Bacteroidales bacterium]